MKEFFLNVINWIFESHALSMPGWAWIVAPVVGGAAVVFFALFCAGWLMENILGVLIFK